MDTKTIARRMYTEGHKTRDIASILGVGRVTIWRWCKDLIKVKRSKP